MTIREIASGGGIAFVVLLNDLFAICRGQTFFFYTHLKLNRIFAKRIKIGNDERKRLS